MKRSARIRRWALSVGAALLGIAPGAFALMAGQSPDSPAARVDPNAASSIYAGVGSVVVGGAPLSGVVIANQYVLTAAHVVNGQAPSSIQFVLNLNGATQWVSAVESVTIYPTYSFPYDDLAVLKLVNTVPSSVPIYQLYAGPLTTGITITLAGYGGSGNGNVGVTVSASSSVKRTGTNVVDALQQTLDTSGLISRFYVYDFDGPTGNGSLGGPTLGNSTETLVAVGDSGSPAFVRSGNSLQLFGINNFVASATGGTVNYQFGTVGGGIVAADPRFAAWLQNATRGTLGQSSISGGDAPLPSWALLLLAIVLCAVSIRRPSRVNVV